MKEGGKEIWKEAREASKNQGKKEALNELICMTVCILFALDSGLGTGEFIPRTAFTVGTAGSGGATALYGAATIGDSTGRVCNKEGSAGAAIKHVDYYSLWFKVVGGMVRQLAGLQVLWNRANMSSIAIFHRCHRSRHVI